MEIVFVSTHLIMITCLTCIMWTVTSKDPDQREKDKSNAVPGSILKWRRIKTEALSRTVAGYWAAFTKITSN
ncbi:MAG: hypothetical protein JWQ63_2873 [Mucilaginibacter sp.]|jgi:hypothetical protein|nr:hypothetical protein [Mucilaginibacter sp.]